MDKTWVHYSKPERQQNCTEMGETWSNEEIPSEDEVIIIYPHSSTANHTFWYVPHVPEGVVWRKQYSNLKFHSRRMGLHAKKKSLCSLLHQKHFYTKNKFFPTTIFPVYQKHSTSPLYLEKIILDNFCKDPNNIYLFFDFNKNATVLKPQCL